MDNATQSSFSFLRYLVKDAKIAVNDNMVSNRMSLQLNLDAEVKEESYLCELTVTVHMNDESNNICVDVVLTGYFEAMNSDRKQRNGFISMNAPAILFPYIRAYVSSLTAQSGIAPIIMPTINLVKQGEELLKKLNTADEEG